MFFVAVVLWGISIALPSSIELIVSDFLYAYKYGIFRFLWIYVDAREYQEIMFKNLDIFHMFQIADNWFVNVSGLLGSIWLCFLISGIITVLIHCTSKKKNY